MDPLKSTYEKQDEIPAEFQPLYEERGGVFLLTGIEGIKTEADVQRVQRALDQEKTAHKDTKTGLDKFASFADMDLEDVRAKLDQHDELKAAADGKIDDEKINSIVEGRLRAKLAPVERERDQLKTANAEKDIAINGYQSKDRVRTIHDAVRAAAVEAKVVSAALDDVLLLSDKMFEVDDTGKVVTRDEVGVLPGIDAKAWLQEMQAKRPHWWPPSQGGGAGGGAGGGMTGDNPWSFANWNLTKQGQVFTAKGRPEAERMAKLAGTTLGGPRPRDPDKK